MTAIYPERMDGCSVLRIGLSAAAAGVLNIRLQLNTGERVI